MVSLVRGERKPKRPARKVGRGAGDVGGAWNWLPMRRRFRGEIARSCRRWGALFRRCASNLAHEAGIVVNVFERFARALGHAEEGVFCHVEGDVDFVRQALVESAKEGRRHR